MPGMLRGVFVMLAASWIVAGPTTALAQTAAVATKPVVTSLGPDFPTSAIFIGNSFFYYNNGMPGHVSLLEKAADPEHKQDYHNTMVTIGGSGFDSRRRELLSAQRHRRHRRADGAIPAD